MPLTSVSQNLLNAEMSTHSAPVRAGPLTHTDILQIAGRHLLALKGKILGFIDVKAPENVEYARHLARTVSKLSPMLGNMVEYNAVLCLNQATEWKGLGHWRRQDPLFPDTVFAWREKPTPGIEIKAWFPLATEITARFKETTAHLRDDRTSVAVIAWLPDRVFYGKPLILDIWIATARSLAEARDNHYHRPPDYLIIEPEDTASRTVNLRQTNTNGYKFQGTKGRLEKAREVVRTWGPRGTKYALSPAYQRKLRHLMGQFKYRLDTNFAKMDRIEHRGLEDFKTRVLNTRVCNRTVSEWARLASKYNKDSERFEKLSDAPGALRPTLASAEEALRISASALEKALGDLVASRG